MGVVVKHSGYISKGIAQLKSHVKYIGFRSNEKLTKELKEELGLGKGNFFDKKHNNTDYQRFIDRVENNKALKYKKSIKAHKFVFSLREKDMDNYLKLSGGKSYKDLIRSTMNQYSKITNQNLDWIAVEHLVEGNSKDGYKKSKHPHVHVIIKGVSENKSGNKIINERVKFNKDDYKLMRDIFDKEFNKVCEYEKFKEYDQFNQIDKALFDKTKKVVKAVQKVVEIDFREKQQERRRLQREQYLNQEKERERTR